MATLHSIHLRTGCFCNSGACQVALRLSCDQLLSNLKVIPLVINGKGHPLVYCVVWSCLW